MSELQRRRAEPGVIEERFRCTVPGYYHCIEKQGSDYRFYRVYVPMPGTGIREVVRLLRKQVGQYQKIDNLRQAIKEHKYGFAVLLETPMRAKAVHKSIETADVGELPLAASGLFLVESVPDFVGTHTLRSPKDVLRPKEDGKTD